jgi:hypothetical protein
MPETTPEHRPTEIRDAELANLYAGPDEPGSAYPLLIEPWQEQVDADWSDESELDAQIFAGLLRLAP